MFLVVGLGNPGPGYAGHRHNIGFMAAEAIVRRHGLGSFRAKFKGRLAEGSVGGEKVLVLMPETFMNLSGEAVGAAARFHKIPPDRVIVLHDDLDIEPGRLRVKTGGGSGGHNGLRSIDEHIGPDYRRVRLGIGHPGDKGRVTGHVLNQFAGEDRDWLDPLLAAVAEALPLLLKDDDAGFMNKVATLTGRNARPAKPEPADKSESDIRKGD